tara:strand:+ start:120 stop:590 length:471 start_codon:yes stop_codon:yes gene_type:complete
MATLLETPVCVKMQECYTDNNGAFNVYYMWDGEKVYNDGGTQAGFIYQNVDATKQQKIDAANWVYANTKEDDNECTYVGCVVILQRCRKAPNKTPLKVLDFAEGYYNEYNRYVVEQILVELEDSTSVWVSYSCIKEMVKGVKKVETWVEGFRDQSL